MYFYGPYLWDARVHQKEPTMVQVGLVMMVMDENDDDENDDDDDDD